MANDPIAPGDTGKTDAPKPVELTEQELADVQGGIALKHKVTQTTDAARDKPKGNDQLAKGIIYSIGR